MTRTAAQRIVVIGAGMGGLAAAASLAAAGKPVTVLEKNPHPGGKARDVPAGPNGPPTGAGPTVFTMKWVFDALFAETGERLDDHVALTRAETIARHLWTDGGRLDLFTDIARSKDAIAAFSGSRDAAAYEAFCAESAGVYEALKSPFIAAEKPGPAALLARAGPMALLKTQPFARLAGRLAKRFSDPRLAQLFARYATYCGSSPYLAPATLMLVAHVERTGVHLVEGGMAALARALADLGARRGAAYRYGVDVAEIMVKEGRTTGVRLRDGEVVEAERVVFNGDVSALGAGLLGPAAAGTAKPTARAKRSLSAVTWLMQAEVRDCPLRHHTVFFDRDYAREFKAVFDDRTITAKPTVYICAQDRHADAEGAPAGAERLLVLINAPADGDRGAPDAATLESAERDAFALLAECGLDLSPTTENATRVTPQDFDALFPATGGALYGPANHGPFASFARAGGRTAIQGLYLAGGSVHPGPGAPMAALSGRIAAARILADDAGRTRTPVRLPAD